MIKIRLERWKEVIRLKYLDGEAHGDMFIGIDVAIEWLDGCYISIDDLSKLMANINKHNNSLKNDDGYKWVCESNSCSNKCKAVWMINDDRDMCMYPTTALKEGANWKPINNNKIEIVEE